jgi:AAA15 family ATPase/GTPase
LNCFNGDYKKIFSTKPVLEESGDITVSYKNGKRGTDPDLTCIRSSSIIAQLKTKMPVTDKVSKDNIRCIDLVLSNLQNILFLDPVPSEMRDYIRSTDTELKVNCENISPVLQKLCSNPPDKETLLNIISKLPENEIKDIEFIPTPLGDVIFALRENYGNTSEAIDAKRLSDGTLRCIAIVTALITEPENSMIVIEEIDNGIHPGRAQKLISSLSEIGKSRKIDIVVTTHNATMLNSFSKSNLNGVSVVYRDKDKGHSKFSRLIDINKMPELFAKGCLGDALVDDSLIGAIKDVNPKPTDFSWMEESK